MANYNFEKLVYKVRTDYLEIMLNSKYKYINGLYKGISPNTFKDINNDDWNIDHRFLTQIDNIVTTDNSTIGQKAKLPNTFKRVPVHKFEATESKFDRLLNISYARNYHTIQSTSNKTDYLTTILDNWSKDGRVFQKSFYVPYYNKDGNVVAYHDYADYLSMLYNVDLRNASWNNTLKDAVILGKDLVILESHPNACESCNYHSGQVYSISGKSSTYPSLDSAIEDGVGHPNCKCQLTIYYDDTQLENQDLVKTDYYDDLQKARGYDRKIRELQNEQDCYGAIDNLDKVGEIQLKIDKLKDTYLLFLTENPQIDRYVNDTDIIFS